jgi:hypothetical protein
MTIISRRQLMGTSLLLLAASPARAAAPVLEVWKDPACGCCSAWARIFENAGFTVTIHEVEDLSPLRSAAGVPADLAGCHSAAVEGYVIEGHVPVDAVRRLLAERPAVKGLAVPGMPLGSPGMEVEGEPPQPFEIIAFKADGSRHLYG